MTVAELLQKHGIKLGEHPAGPPLHDVPAMLGEAQKAHQAEKCLGVTIEAGGGVRWGCNHCNWTGPEKGSGERRRTLTSLHLSRRRRRVAFPQGAQPAGPRAALLARTAANGRGGWNKGHEGRRHQASSIAPTRSRKAIGAGRDRSRRRGREGCGQPLAHRHPGDLQRARRERTGQASRNGRQSTASSSPAPTSSSSTITMRPAMSTPTRPASCRSASPSASGGSI